jgi:diguanylate cyclase
VISINVGGAVSCVSPEREGAELDYRTGRTQGISTADARSDAARLEDLRPSAIGSGRDHALTITYARAALATIDHFKLPADPPSFEVWYAYATGHNPSLNQSINELLDNNAPLSVAELERIRGRHFSSVGAVERMGSLGTRIGDEVDRAVAKIDAAIGLAADYQDNLAGAGSELNEITDPATLRRIVEGLVLATRHIELRYHDVQTSLDASKQEIVELRSRLAAISVASLTDALTNLGNRRHFDETLQRIFGDCEGTARSFSLLLCDIDHFKAINDKFGHPVGDQVLRLIASMIKQAVRDYDVTARYGGEEFALILPDTTLQQAWSVAEKLRLSIAGRSVVKRSSGESIGQVTISIGAAQLRPDDTLQTLVERADNCLYAAKRNGRNRVVAEALLAGDEQSSLKTA